MKQEIQASRAGNSQESWRLKQEFMKQVKEKRRSLPLSGSLSPSRELFRMCDVHRGHQDHLPYCMWEMVNQKISGPFRFDGRILL